jgi:hypothetical protein
MVSWSRHQPIYAISTVRKRTLLRAATASCDRKKFTNGERERDATPHC